MHLRIALLSILGLASMANATQVKVDNPNIRYSPYNWYRSGSEFAQSPNPGAYLKTGFTGTSIALEVDVSPFTKANVPAVQYPVIRYSIDEGPASTIQLTPLTKTVECGKGLPSGNHRLLVQYVAGYVFLDFWSPVNVLRITGFSLDDSARLDTAFNQDDQRVNRALFLGDSITNGDDNIATFKGGITNAVDTQDATIGYPSIVAAATKSEYGVVAYGGASWDATAADGHTPELMTFWDKVDKEHSRMVDGTYLGQPVKKFEPIPDDIYINMGENRAPNYISVCDLLLSLNKASGPKTNIFVIVPFSGRARLELEWGLARFSEAAPRGARAFLIDLGNNPYLPDNRPTMFSVDGQHPLAALHAQLGAQIVAERARLLAGK